MSASIVARRRYQILTHHAGPNAKTGSLIYTFGELHSRVQYDANTSRAYAAGGLGRRQSGSLLFKGVRFFRSMCGTTAHKRIGKYLLRWSEGSIISTHTVNQTRTRTLIKRD